MVLSILCSHKAFFRTGQHFQFLSYRNQLYEVKSILQNFHMKYNSGRIEAFLVVRCKGIETRLMVSTIVGYRVEVDLWTLW